MAYKFIKHLESAQYNRKLFYIDQEGDSLPPIRGTSTENTSKNAFNYTKEEVQPGSECRVLSSTDKYVLNTLHEWIQVREPMQEYLSALEEKFFLYFGGLISEIKTQGEANKLALDNFRTQMTTSLETLNQQVKTQGEANKVAIDANTAALSSAINTNTSTLNTVVTNNTTAITTQGAANKTGLDSISSAIVTGTASINANIDQTQTLITATNSTLNTINSSTDQIEGYIDGLENLTTTIRDSLGTNSASPTAYTVQAKLNTIIGHVDGVEGTLTAINTNVDGVEGTLNTISSNTSGTNTRLGNTNDAAGTNTVIGQLKRLT